MRYLIFLVLVSTSFFLSCSTSRKNDDSQGDRKVASLDNNGDIKDDSFDANLETYFGGTAKAETDANNAVAKIIMDFVTSQKKVRDEVKSSDKQDEPEARRVFKDLPQPSYATRDVHRKTNGCFKAEVNFRSDLMQNLNAQISNYSSSLSDSKLTPISNEDDLGIFAHAASYDAIVRFSNGHPGNRPDKLADARGFAVKILSKGTLSEVPLKDMNADALNTATKLDILSINFPTFFVNDPIKYADLNRVALNSALDFKNKKVAKAEEFWSIFVSAKMTSLERRLTLWVNGSVIYSPLFQDYFSMVPSRLGPEGAIRAVKYSWQPVTCLNTDSRIFAQDIATFIQEKKDQWADWTKDRTYAFPPHEPSALKKLGFPDNYLRKNVTDRLSKNDFCFNLYMQLYRDPVSTSIEDSTDIWLRSDDEKKWWAKDVVPGFVIWNTSGGHNTESRSSYLEKFDKKQIAPRVLAAQLKIKHLEGQDFNSDAAENNKTCEDLSFNPWNGDIAHHKPLGIVSRMKRKVYNASRRTRHELNGIDDKASERH